MLVRRAHVRVFASAQGSIERGLPGRESATLTDAQDGGSFCHEIPDERSGDVQMAETSRPKSAPAPDPHPRSMKTFFVSVYRSSADIPSSRPIPDIL